MANPWIEVSRILIPIEGAIGMILNLMLIFYLLRTNIGQVAHLYYYSCVVTTILSFYTSFGILITVDLPAIIDGKLIAIFYGPLLFYFPEWVNDVICVAFFAQAHTLWEMLPAPSILQWLALSKIDISNFTKLVLAYALPLAFNLLAWTVMPNFLPSDELRMELAESVNRLHGTNISEFHIYGFRVKDANHFDGIDLFVFDFIPSYIVSYTLVALCAYKIRRKLSALGTSISEKTKQMQLRFLLTQIAQGEKLGNENREAVRIFQESGDYQANALVFLPLVLTSLPLALLCGAAVLGRDLHNFPFFMALMMWPVPAFTALLNLGFVRKTASNKTPQVSTSKNSFAHQAKTNTSVAPIRTH